MNNEELIIDFFGKYTTKAETICKLPLSVSIDDIWHDELRYRIEQAAILPLYSAPNENYWYVQIPRISRAGDRLAELARNEAAGELMASEERIDRETLIDEAYYTSAVEGAEGSTEKAHRMIEKGIPARTRDEQMIRGSYEMLCYTADHLYEPVTEEMLIKMARLLSKSNEGGYRKLAMNIKNTNGEVPFTTPEAAEIPDMMKALISFVQDVKIHPIIKAAAAQLYVMRVQPFTDGNGRIARALSYIILMNAGYDFFGRVAFSAQLAGEKGRYYRAVMASLNRENGLDFTYFMSYYIDQMARSLEGVSDKLQYMSRLKAVEAILDPVDDKRVIAGARWLVQSRINTVTTEQWRKHFDISFETARQDLKRLEDIGFVNKNIVGRKHYYEIW